MAKLKIESVVANSYKLRNYVGCNQTTFVTMILSSKVEYTRNHFLESRNIIMKNQEEKLESHSFKESTVFTVEKQLWVQMCH